LINKVCRIVFGLGISKRGKFIFEKKRGEFNFIAIVLLYNGSEVGKTNLIQKTPLLHKGF